MGDARHASCIICMFGVWAKVENSHDCVLMRFFFCFLSVLAVLELAYLMVFCMPAVFLLSAINLGLAKRCRCSMVRRNFIGEVLKCRLQWFISFSWQIC